MTKITTGSKLATVAGKSAGKIEKALGLRVVGDLLHHYPRRYVDKGDLSDLTSLVVDEHVTVIARVVSARSVAFPDRRRGGTAYRLEVTVATQGQQLFLTFFDKQPHVARWRARSLVPGAVGLFAGKVGRFGQRWQLVNPQTKLYTDKTLDSGLDQAHSAWEEVPDLLAIYPAAATVQSWQLEEAIHLALDLVEEVPDPLPASVRLRHGLLSARQALEWIHRPGSRADVAAAERTLRFSEAFVTQTLLARRRASLRAVPAQPRPGVAGGLLDRFDARLPFPLTAGQRQVSEQILTDLASGHPMHRLLQGEVGSGKTVVALRAMLRVVDSGGQAALLAPTEVLAQQHHRTITALLGDLADGGMLGGAEGGTRVASLTGSASAAGRRSTLLELASREVGIVVGTHALLEQDVEFADLGLVVVDEQHRFGVEQRAALPNRAGHSRPHVLVMTATPIPRTVAMTVFGDLETSTLVDLPAGRAPISTVVVPTLDRPDWLERAWARVREEVAAGRRAYVVCPRVGGDRQPRSSGQQAEPDASPDNGSDSGSGGCEDADLAAVEEVAPALTTGPLQGLRLETLHGRLPAERKEWVMRSFADGEVDVLVSTTVVEVGLDVADATVMVVLDADRFGVSQLHQLRGRVGRGEHPSLCLLATRSAPGTPGRARLEAVAATRDGFALARIDLEQRREGDVLGVAQSGRRSGLRLLSVLRDEEVIAAARQSATDNLREHPDLSGQPGLAAAVRQLVESDQGEFLEKA